MSKRKKVNQNGNHHYHQQQARNVGFFHHKLALKANKEMQQPNQPLEGALLQLFTDLKPYGERALQVGLFVYTVYSLTNQVYQGKLQQPDTMLNLSNFMLNEVCKKCPSILGQAENMVDKHETAAFLAQYVSDAAFLVNTTSKIDHCVAGLGI